MKFRGNVLTSSKLAKQKLEILRNIQKDALLQGVTTVVDIDEKLNEAADYDPSLFFPLNELNRPLLFMKEFQDALSEARATEGLVNEYIQALINLQEETYVGTRSILNDWFNVQERINSLINYEKYLYRSTGATLSVLPISFFTSPENQIQSVFKDCYTTLSNQLTLPIKKKCNFPIRKVEISGYSNDSDKYVNETIQFGSFVFRITENIEKEQITILVELEQEEQVNHVRIPCTLPLPQNIDYIQFLDSSDRQTRLFDSNTLAPLLERVPVALELIFPPTPIKRIKIRFKKNLDTRKLGLVSKVEMTDIEANISSVLAKNIELLNARGHVNRHSLEPMVHDIFSSFKTLLVKQDLNSIDVYSGIFGAVVEASLTSFERGGTFSTQVYSGKDVKFSSVIARGQLVDNLGNLLDLNTEFTSSNLPIVFVNFQLIKSCLDDNRNLLSRIFTSHPLSRPFNKQVIELLTAQNSQDRKSEFLLSQQEYALNIYSSDSSSVSLYTPTLESYVPVSGNVNVDSSTRLTTVTSNNPLLEDIICLYTVDAPDSPNLAALNDSRPYFVSPSGSVAYRDPEDNIEFCDFHLLLEMHRVNYTEYVTPVIDKTSIVLGHKANARTKL